VRRPTSLLSLKLNLGNRPGGAIISANPGKTLVCTRDERIDRTTNRADVGGKQDVPRTRLRKRFTSPAPPAAVVELANKVIQALSLPLNAEWAH